MRVQITKQQKHENIMNLIADKVDEIITVKYSCSNCGGSLQTKTGKLVRIHESNIWEKELYDGSKAVFDSSHIEIMYNGRKNPQVIDFDQIIYIR